MNATVSLFRLEMRQLWRTPSVFIWTMVLPIAKVASGVGAVVAIVMWFFAGMWVPRQVFPDWLARIADWTPGGASATLLTNAGIGAELGWQPFVCLVLWGLGGFLVAVRTFKWE